MRPALFDVEGRPHDRDAVRGLIRALSAVDLRRVSALSVADVYEGMKHTGNLGMGVLPTYRGRGVGRRLLDAAIEAAPRNGIWRIELEVFGSNVVARRLYAEVGFVEEGVKRRARSIDGMKDDIVCMALLLA